MANKIYTATLQLPDGTRKFYRAATRREAERKRDEAKMQLRMGVNLADDTTVQELADIWFRLYKEGQLHKRSEETIRNTLNRYVLPVLGNMKVRDVRAIHVQQLMKSVSKYSKSTQKKVLQATRNIFKVAIDNGIVAKSPVGEQTRAGGADPAEKKPLTYAQSDALLSAVKDTRAYPLVLILLYGGLRIGEALGLMWNDFDFDKGTVTVNRSIIYPESNRRGEINTEMKTENAHRTIPLPWEVVAELKKEMQNSHSLWVFSMRDGDFLSYNSFRSLWRLIDYRTKQKVAAPRRELVDRTLDFEVHPHLLRHTCITRWLLDQHLEIKEVQYLAGHATSDITMDIYTHYVKEERMAATAKKIQAAV